MSIQTLQIQPLDLRTASEHEYCALNKFENHIRAELLPDDPPIPLAEAIQKWRNIPKFVDVYCWVAWTPDGSALVANGEASISRTDSNQHMLWFTLQVLPDFRQQGLGQRLLAPIVAVARSEQRRLLMTATYDRIPAGAAFVQRLGAQQGLEGHTNQLALADLDRNLIRQWQARSLALATDFELCFWPGAWPEEHIEATATLINTGINTQPRDRLQLEDRHYTPEQIRQWERSFVAGGAEHWTMVVRSRTTGRFAGLTDVLWHPSRPALVQQGWTVVLPDYRQRGLGRWLKAAMLDKVLCERPQVQFVRTGNADSNAAMLKINHELGFQPYMSHWVWQVETARVAAYLNGELQG